MKDFDIRAAAIRAGYGKAHANSNAYELIKRFKPYIDSLRQKKATAITKEIAIDQNDIIQSWARIAYHDRREFVKLVPRIKKVCGVSKEVLVETMKPLGELTDMQAQVVADIWMDGNGELRYKLENRAAARENLGRHLGLLHDKLIQEHRHAHLHAAVDLRNLSAEQLTQAEGQLRQLLGSAADSVLGPNRIIGGEYEVVDEDSDTKEITGNKK